MCFELILTNLMDYYISQRPIISLYRDIKH